MSSKDLWREIVLATSGLDSHATALRVPLLIEFPQPRRPARKRVGDVLRAAHQFFRILHGPVLAPPKGRILFAFAHVSPANMNNLLPVAREALRRNILGGIVTGGNYSKELREFMDVVPVVSAQQLVAQLGAGERLRNIRYIATAYRRIKRALSLRSPALALCLAGHRTTLGRALVESVVFGSVFERLLDHWSPCCVVSTSDFWTLEHQLCCQATRRQIVSVVIQHGAIGDHWWPFVADLYCLWGDACADQMRGLGAPAERLATIGMPGMDAAFRRRKAELRDKVRGVSRRPVCLILSHTNGRRYEPEVYEGYKQFLSEVINRTPSAHWKVRLHPAEDDSFYRDLDPSISGRLNVHSKQTSLDEAVEDADVVTTIYSTSGLEAMIMGRPLIVAPASNRVRELAPWPAAGGGIYAFSAEEFSIQFERLVSHEDWRVRQLEHQEEFLAGHFANRGRSAECLVDLLEKYSEQANWSRETERLLHAPLDAAN